MSTTFATIPEAAHHTVPIHGNDLHFVTAGLHGTPVLLVHGFPESWWAFHKIIPMLSTDHRVVAVDLPGFGDSGTGSDVHDSRVFADALGGLIDHLGMGPVHLLGQDIGGIPTYRLAATSPHLVRSYTGIEMALPGYGLEQFADVANGGMWHVGFMATPGIPDLLLKGREREFLTGFAYPAMNGTEGAIGETDVDEFVRVLSRDRGLRGANGFYGSMLHEGAEIRSLAADRKLTMPVLAVDGGSGGITSGTLMQVASDVTTVTMGGVGHLVAMEAPRRLADEMLAFYRTTDA
jgi:pimeloyl-ACP methyl ester carboxylesterase